MSSFAHEFDQAIKHLKYELNTVRTGRAHPDILENIQVESYGVLTPLKGVGNISVQDAKTLLIQIWDKNNLSAVEKAIQKSDLGINPLVDGQNVRIIFPDLTEERRKELVKQIHSMGEKAKISIRNDRQKVLNEIKEAELTEDDEKREKTNLQEDVDSYNKQIDEVIKKKEAELMTV